MRVILRQASNYEEQTLTDHPNIDFAGPDSHNNETVTAAVEPDSIKAQAVNMTDTRSEYVRGIVNCRANFCHTVTNSSNWAGQY